MADSRPNDSRPNDSKPNDIKTLTDIKKIVIDFTRDILVTFPEQKGTLNPHLQNLLNDSDINDSSLTVVYSHCKKVYPERFFDILYQNVEVFNKSIEFLPGIDFSLLWADKDLTDKTRETIWKYLQLLLFTMVSTISDGSSFGDTAKLFEAIDENEFKKKLEETIEQMQNVFTGNGSNEKEEGSSEEGNTTGEQGSEKPNINLDDLPDPKDIHEHVTSMMNGKLGTLAREIAEETASELNMDMEDASSVGDVFKKLFQNPTKLMSLVKNVGSKLDTKLKSGDMKESELLQEASDIMQKMKSMPGMGDLQSMLAKMGMGHMMPGGSGGGGKVNVNAMKSNLDRNIKAAKNKERMLANLEKRQKEARDAKEATATTTVSSSKLKNVGIDNTGFENLVFSKGEQVERSSIERSGLNPSQKKKKNKNKNKIKTVVEPSV